MTVLVRDLAAGKDERVSHAYRKPGAPTRTAFNPALSADGRIVAFEATDAGRDGAPSRNGLWVVDRKAKRERLVTDASRGAAYLPELSGDGQAVAYTSATLTNHGLTHVYLTSLKTGRTSLISRADGAKGAPAAGDAYEPSVSRDGRFVAFTSRARNLGGDGHADIYVRDVDNGTTRLVTGAIKGDAGAPSLSADGRYVAFTVRSGRPNGTPRSLRTKIWRHDLTTGEDVLVSRATGARGVSADGYATDPSISEDGLPGGVRVDGRQPRRGQAGRDRRRLRARPGPQHDDAAEHARPPPGLGRATRCSTWRSPAWWCSRWGSGSRAGCCVRGRRRRPIPA